MNLGSLNDRIADAARDWSHQADQHKRAAADHRQAMKDDRAARPHLPAEYRAQADATHERAAAASDELAAAYDHAAKQAAVGLVSVPEALSRAVDFTGKYGPLISAAAAGGRYVVARPAE